MIYMAKNKDNNENIEKKGNSKLIIIILAVVIVVLGAIIGIMFATNTSVSDVKAIFEKEIEQTIPMEEFLVNIQSDTSRNHFVKMNIALMYTNPKNEEHIHANIFKIRDIVIKYLMQKERDDFKSHDSLYTVKEELIELLNEGLGEDMIKDIYITDMLVQ